MRIADIVNTLEVILLKQRQLKDCKPEETEKMKKIQGVLQELEAALPTAGTWPLEPSIRDLAYLNSEMTLAGQEIKKNEAEMEKLTAASSVDAWKWSMRKEGPKEPAAVAKLRLANKDLKAKMETLESYAEPVRRLLMAEQRAIDDAIELDAWANACYPEPSPAPITKMIAAEQKELEAGCERLVIPKRRSVIVVI